MELPLGECARLASIGEATARKAGNVHPGRDFPGLRYSDFLASAAAVAPVFEAAGAVPVGQTVLEAIRATRGAVATNTNLGIVLLLAPLAAVPRAQSLEQGIGAVLAGLTLHDARHVFAAIRLAHPGGLGKVPEQDTAGEPTAPLRAIMALAAERDLIARQYVNDFHDILADGLPTLLLAHDRFGDLEQAIIYTHLHFVSEFPDSLICRKRGRQEADEASRRARSVLDAGWPASRQARDQFAALDDWLRAVGNARNPGTSADLVTAVLFAALREGKLTPSEFPASRTA